MSPENAESLKEITSVLEQITMYRDRSRAYGEVKVVMNFVEGHLETYRIMEENIRKKPRKNSQVRLDRIRKV